MTTGIHLASSLTYHTYYDGVAFSAYSDSTLGGMTAKVNVGNTYGIASSMETRLGNVSRVP